MTFLPRTPSPMPHVTLPALLFALLPAASVQPPDDPDFAPPVVEQTPPLPGEADTSPFDDLPGAASGSSEQPPADAPNGDGAAMQDEPNFRDDPTGELRDENLLQDEPFDGVAPGEVPPGENPPGDLMPADAFRLPPMDEASPGDPTGELREEGLLQDEPFRGVAPGNVPPGENPPGDLMPGEVVEDLLDALNAENPPATVTLTPLGELIRAPYDIYDAREYIAANCLREAEQVLAILLERNPADPRLHYLQFVLRYRENRFDEAFKVLEDAVQAEQASPIVGYDEFMQPVQGRSRVYLERVRGLAGISD